MSKDVAKVINESIQSFIDAGNAEANTVADTQKAAGELMSKAGKAYVKKVGKGGDWLYSKLHPEKGNDLQMKTVQKAAKALVAERKKAADMGVGEHLAKAGGKALENVKEAGKKYFTTVPGEISVPRTALLGASALAAGLGGLAAVKKMREAAKKEKK